jgi:hypothetical protein
MRKRIPTLTTLLAFCLLGCGQPPKPVPEASPTPSFKLGSRATLYSTNPMTPLAADTDTLLEVEKLWEAGDEFGLKELLVSGRVIGVATGTPVLIIDEYAGAAFKVRVLEGEQKNAAGWVDAAWLKPSSGANSGVSDGP